MAQKCFNGVYAGEQGDVDLVLKSYVFVVGSERQTVFTQSCHRLAAAVAWNAASDARVLGAVRIVVKPQQCLAPERDRAS